MGEGASFALAPPRPLPFGRGGLLQFGTTGAPRRMSARASLACAVGARAQPIHIRAQVRSRWDRRLGRVCPRTDSSGKSAVQ